MFTRRNSGGSRFAGSRDDPAKLIAREAGFSRSAIWHERGNFIGGHVDPSLWRIHDHNSVGRINRSRSAARAKGIAVYTRHRESIASDIAADNPPPPPA